MTKFIKVLILAALLIGFVLSGNASAQLLPSFNNYTQIYTTAAQGDFTPKTDAFAWDQKPWLFVKLLDQVSNFAGASLTQTMWTWNNPSPTLPDQTNFVWTQDTNNNIWISFTDAYWQQIRQSGDWTVVAFSNLNPGTTSMEGNLYNIKSFYGNANFSVMPAPEPVSSSLFVLGSLMLGGRVLRRRIA